MSSLAVLLEVKTTHSSAVLSLPYYSEPFIRMSLREGTGTRPNHFVNHGQKE